MVLLYYLSYFYLQWANHIHLIDSDIISYYYEIYDYYNVFESKFKDIYKIIEFLHVKPGKGPFVRTKLKSVTTGKVIDNTFTSGHKIDDVKVMTSQYQFLYNDSETIILCIMRISIK